jgi:mono/diheme cytochrome c family protein
MRILKTALAWLGALSLLGLAVGAILFLRWGQEGFTARATPGPMETRLALTFRRWAVPQTFRAMRNPVGATPSVLEEASAHWADHCALCHGNDGRGQTEMGQRLYPRPPDMTQPGTQTLSDGELYHAIQNGIRLSGMPAWGEARTDDASTWGLVAFIRHLPALSAAEKERMQKLNPRSPAEEQEEADDAAFLRGGTPSPPQGGKP